MKKILNYFIIGMLISFAYNCEEGINDNASFNYLTFEAASVDFGVEIGGSSARDIMVYTANKTGSDRTYNIVVDPLLTTADSYTVASSVTIPGGTNVGALPVSISDMNLDAGATIVLRFEGSQDNTSGDLTINAFQQCGLNEVTLSFVFVNYPEENGWELTNSAGVVASAAVGTYDGLADFTTTWCLPDGDYTFTMFDEPYNDGMCCAYGDGSYQVTSSTGILASGGAFGASESTSFSLP